MVPKICQSPWANTRKHVSNIMVSPVLNALLFLRTWIGTLLSQVCLLSRYSKSNVCATPPLPRKVEQHEMLTYGVLTSYFQCRKTWFCFICAVGCSTTLCGPFLHTHSGTCDTQAHVTHYAPRSGFPVLSTITALTDPSTSVFLGLMLRGEGVSRFAVVRHTSGLSVTLHSRSNCFCRALVNTSTTQLQDCCSLIGVPPRSHLHVSFFCNRKGT